MAKFNNYLSAVKHEIDRVMYKKQRRNVNRLAGKEVSRYGKVLRIIKSNSSEVNFLNVVTGVESKMSTKSFFSRKVDIIKPVPSDKNTMEIPVSDRAYSIAVSVSLDFPTKMSWLNRMRADTQPNSVDREACEWYIGQLKNGIWPIKKFKQGG